MASVESDTESTAWGVIPGSSWAPPGTPLEPGLLVCLQARRYSSPLPGQLCRGGTRSAARLPWSAMKPRAWRVVLGAAALVAVLVAALVVSHWSTARDHVEAWHFQTDA